MGGEPGGQALAWTTTTSAECAWVLWLRGSDIKMSWAILEAFSSLPACDESLYLDMDKLKRDGYEVRGDQKSGHGFLAPKGEVM